MGQHADDAVNEALDLEVRHSMYAAGQISDYDAYEEGLVDELGCTPPEVMHLYNQVDDMFSLEQKLDTAMLEFQVALQNKIIKNLQIPKHIGPVEHIWEGADGEQHKPHMMTTAHLRNAIAYAKRNNMDHPTVDVMIQVLADREGLR